MTNCKLLLAVTFLFLSTILSLSCNKDSPDNKPNSLLKANETSFIFSWPAASDTLVITSNIDWKISGIPAWLTISPTSGNGTTTVYIACQENKAKSDRTVSLKLEGSDIPSTTITITQSGLSPAIYGYDQFAKGGDTIQISGVNFSATTSGNSVTINGRPAIVVSATTTYLQVVVPQQAGNGLLELKVDNKSSQPFPFIYDWVGVVSILAGGTAGYEDGTGSNAKFWHPAGLGIDEAGNIYVADYANNKVRKISTTGVVTTLPGRIPDWTNPTGPNTDFGIPSDVAIDANGNIYIAETNSNAVSKITPDGTVSLFAGGNQSGYADGTGTDASFYWPTGIDVDPSGNVYVAEISNHRIRKISPAGIVTTIAGSTQGYAEGTGTAAFFNMPYSLAIDPSGIIYVSDYWNNRVRKINTSALVSTFAKDIGYVSTLFRPLDIAIDKNGIIYTGDEDNRLFFINQEGVINMATDFEDIAGNAFEFSSPAGITVNQTGEVFVSDYYNNRICKVSFK